MVPAEDPIEISRREVLNNVIRFKTKVWEEPFTEDLPLLLNTRTGDIRFAEKISHLEHPTFSGRKPQKPLAEWKKVQLHIAKEKNRLQVELFEDKNHSLTERGLEPLAWRVVQETVEVLNEIIAKHTTREKVSERTHEAVKAALKDLSHIRLTLPKGYMEDLPGWRGFVDRVAAEKELREAPKGTYVLREIDVATRSIAFALSQENRTHIHAYVCTVVEAEEKISDILILHTSKGWTVYNDNPNLSDYTYAPSPQSLLLTINHRAKHPLQ